MHFTRVLAQLICIVLNHWDYACIECMQSFLKCDKTGIKQFSYVRFDLDADSFSISGHLYICIVYGKMITQYSCQAIGLSWKSYINRVSKLFNKLFYLLHLIFMTT